MNKNIQLSEHFKLSELTRTTYDELQEQNNTINDSEVEKLTELCVNILEPIRKQFRLPIIINSGYRCVDLNKRVGGSESSQHTYAEAADFYVRGLDDLEGSTAVFRWIHHDSGIKFGQIIHEVRRKTTYESIWIHISLGIPYRHKSVVGQVLTFRNGLYTFLRSVPS